MSRTPLTIYSNVQLAPPLLQRLQSGLPPHRLVQSAAPSASNLQAGQPDPAARHADVAWGQPAVEDILTNPTIRYVQLTSAGYDRYDRPDVREALRLRNGLLCNASSVYTEPCAEHVLCQILAATRHLPQALRTQFTTRDWPQVDIRAASRLLLDQTVLIVGFGAIGRRLAELLAPFRMSIIATRLTPRGHEAIPTYPSSQLDSLLPQADHIVNLLPASPATHQIFNAPRFARMKPTATFYNIGRGSTVDQSALIAALNANRLAAAYLDVTTPEPLEKDNPLWTTPRVFITPHSAGGFDREFETHIDLLLTNLSHFANGTPPIDRVI